MEALRRLRAENGTGAAGARDERAPITQVFLERWLEATKSRVRAKTFTTYELVVRLHVIEADPVLAAMPIDRVRPAHVSALLRSLEHAKKSARVRELVYLRLRSAFATAVGVSIATNPVLAIHRPRVERRSMTTWTRDQARAFLGTTAADELSALYRLALSAGLRRGELLALRWRDVDVAKRRLAVQHTLTDAGEIAEAKTRGSRRAIELPQRVVDALAGQKTALERRGLAATPWVFPGEDGGPLAARELTRAFDAAIARAKVPRIRFHDLRHTAATLHLEAGAHPKVVQEMLGHASITITLDLYSHVSTSLQRETADRFNEVL